MSKKVITDITREVREKTKESKSKATGFKDQERQGTLVAFLIYTDEVTPKDSV